VTARHYTDEARLEQDMRRAVAVLSPQFRAGYLPAMHLVNLLAEDERLIEPLFLGMFPADPAEPPPARERRSLWRELADVFTLGWPVLALMVIVASVALIAGAR
jgi:hypothetical protein